MVTESSAAIYSKNYLESIRRSRDIVKKMSQGIEYNILGLEIQDKIHYGMPLRTMTYDTLGYIKEYNDIRNRHKQNNDLCHTSESFLSGINKTLEDLRTRLHICVNALEDWYFDDDICRRTLQEQFHAATMEGLGIADYNCGTDS